MTKVNRRELLFNGISCELIIQSNELLYMLFTYNDHSAG